MLDFTFEIMDESTINLQILYAGEWFTFNIYLSDNGWTLHPFDGILIRNKDMCRLVVSDLFKNKYFHVMCAKENIRLSELRTSIRLEHESESEGSESSNNRVVDSSGDLQSFVDEHSIEDIIEIEKEVIWERRAFYKQILENMFMQGYGPADKEFMKIQSIIQIWTDAHQKLNGSSGSDSWNDHRKRW